MPLTLSIFCGNCSQGVGAELMAGDLQPGHVAWLRCPSCGDGSVRIKNGAVYPVAHAGGTVTGLPPDVAQAWREARAAHAVAAYTASEIMCRKILMHLAVDVAESAEGGTFKSYVEDLDKTGYISAGVKAAAEKVKNRGNAANHELPASTEADSLMTLRITEHLLRGIYEFSSL